MLTHRTSTSSRQHDGDPSNSGHVDLPSQTFHPFPYHLAMPQDILSMAASGTHYAGAKTHHRRSDIQRASASASRDSEMSEGHQRVLKDLTELFECRPTHEIFERSWHPEATFEAPLIFCAGIEQIASQWYAMSGLYAKAETLSKRVLSSTSHPNRIIFAQTLRLTLRLLHIKKTVKSVVIVDLTDDDKILRVEDQWNGGELPNAWGVGSLRKLNGKLATLVVRLPKEMKKPHY